MALHGRRPRRPQDQDGGVLLLSEVKEEPLAGIAGQGRGTEAARAEPEGSARLPKALPRYQRQGTSRAEYPAGLISRHN